MKLASHLPQMTRIVKRLLSQSPLVYVGLYVVTFVVFGVLFRLIPGDFYHSTSTFEPAIHEDRDALRDELTGALRAQFRRGHGGRIARFQQWYVDSDELRVLGVEAHEEGLSFDLGYVVHAEADGRETMRAVWKSAVLLSKRANRITQFPPSGSITYIFPNIDASETIGLPEPLRGVILSILLPSDQRGFVSGQPVVVVPVPLFNRINSYWAAVHGFPGTSSGEWGRMLYLSAATITTLGYGDVVPLTSRARFLVGLEALTGIALIGLFLNACAAARQPSSG